MNCKWEDFKTVKSANNLHTHDFYRTIHFALRWRVWYVWSLNKELIVSAIGCFVYILCFVSFRRCSFWTSSQSREGKKIPRKGSSLFFQVNDRASLPSRVHTNPLTQTHKYVMSADLSTVSHRNAGTGSYFCSWLTHKSRWNEQRRSLRTTPINKKKMRREGEREREGVRERDLFFSVADAAVLFPGHPVSRLFLFSQQSFWQTPFFPDISVRTNWSTTSQIITGFITLFIGLLYRWLDKYEIKWIIRSFTAIVRKH